MTAVKAEKEICSDSRCFKGLNTIYENISKYHCSQKFFDNYQETAFFLFKVN